ncbi:hypothetical protein COCSUDRAFT_58299 [Coccomyxa subellipsoidea C-169]|uniref:Uncharacterized protein n=1 Tax=Coccomyxa subellipsoidea (strain C-169) TaxID=574566 RepID=I0YMD2_COCSC|nr:hypothetical protein COCSUDRAFT_58299 [Coccomyxa subellipsoidea C-169]EIE19551.1 hypothetical protein COCSUDRAFT_58299 [Coccomyxa subellipsoidea C-169]|eukprot:XP_005644095.1 hypothetical protein COCSUDRAFT_58299 [Coccomyxa subellipsoidea C-169]
MWMHACKLQATVAEYRSLQQQLEGKLSAAADNFKAAQKEAATAAQAAEQRLTQTQEELVAARTQLKESAHAAAAATERADELEWRLKRQEATLAERLRMADQAKQATEGLSEEGLRAVREKAAFLGEELRAQLAYSREMLAEERRLRRAAEAAAAETEAGLKLRLEAASADISALRDQVNSKRTRIHGLEEACRQQQTKAAMDVVTSLVGDLDPPDTEPRRRPSLGDAAAAQLPPLPEADSLAAPPPQQHAPHAGADAAEPGREQQPPKKQKRGSKSKAAQAEQLVAAGSFAETAQPAAKPSQAATSAAQDPSDKKSQARAAKKQAKAAAGAEEAEIVGAAKVDKRGDKASKKRKTEEAAASAANTSEQQADESTHDATMTHDESAMTQGGGRARAARTRASKAPYWMGGAADDDSAPAGDDSPTDKSPGGADPEADSDWEAPKPAAKKHKGQEPHQAMAEESKPDKPKRARKKAQETAQQPPDDAEVAEGSADVAEKPAAAGKGRRKLVKAGQAAAGEEEAAELAADAVEEAQPHAKKGAQRRKGKGAVSAALGEAAQPEQPQEDVTTADHAVTDSGVNTEVEQEEQQDVKIAATQELSQGPAQSAAEFTVNPRKVSQWQQSRPEGVSKVDLTTVWGHTRTPLADTATAAGVAADKEAAGPGKEKENGDAAKAAAGHELIKPVPGRSRFGSQSEANPLAALNPGVLAAAVKAQPRGSYVSGLSAPNRGGEVAAGKRRLLPAPKPMGSVAALPRSMLFGQNFQIPKLSQ